METSSAFINMCELWAVNGSYHSVLNAPRWRIKNSPRPAFGKSLYIPNHENPAKDYIFLTLLEVQEKELRMAEGEEGMVGCKQNLPSNPLIRKGFLDSGLLACWQTDPKIDSISPVVYLQYFSSTEFITFWNKMICSFPIWEQTLALCALLSLIGFSFCCFYFYFLFVFILKSLFSLN